MTIRRSTTACVCIVVALAMCALAVTPAMAVSEFLHEGKEVVKKSFNVKSKTAAILFVELAGTKYRITCASSTASGKIKGKTEVEGVVIKFKTCFGKEGEEAKTCEVKSISPPGAPEEIITKTLKGRLGEVAKAEAASERGLLLEATTGTVFVTIKGSSECLPAESSEVKGGLLGEIKPIKSAKLKSELFYKVNGAGISQTIKKFTGETATHELEVFEVKTPLESSANIEFEELVEVT